MPQLVDTEWIEKPDDNNHRSFLCKILFYTIYGDLAIFRYIILRPHLRSYKGLIES